MPFRLRQTGLLEPGSWTFTNFVHTPPAEQEAEGVEAVKWCYEQIPPFRQGGVRWKYHVGDMGGYWITFYDEIDALNFKMRWA